MGAREDAMKWFQASFAKDISEATAGTPFPLAMITAIAYQETGYIWQKLYKTRTPAEVLKLCVGDTIDSPNRSAFPRNRAALEAHPQGKEMFAIARAALKAIGPLGLGYASAAATQNKFCHGYGILQYDIQFFKEDPNWFLGKKWETFAECARKAVGELKNGLKRAYPQGKSQLSFDEMVYVCIAYNRGSVNFSKGFRQGFRDEDGVYYGEHIADYLQTAMALPHPNVGKRLILVKPDSSKADGWAYRGIQSAKYENGTFTVDKSDIDAFLGVQVSGAQRQPIRKVLDGLKLKWAPRLEHIDDADDPRAYIWIGGDEGGV